MNTPPVRPALPPGTSRLEDTWTESQEGLKASELKGESPSASEPPRYAVIREAKGDVDRCDPVPVGFSAGSIQEWARPGRSRPG